MLERKVDALETLFTFPDHTSRWFEIRIEPVREGICVHSFDIQSQKEAQTLLQEQESMATLGRMAAVVAHEIKNPLAGLSGALQVLKSRRLPTDADWRARARFTPFIVDGTYGTRASTVILVSSDGTVRFHERRYGPGGESAGQSREEFALHLDEPLKEVT